MEDDDGAAWISVTVKSGWPIRWESADKNQWNQYNGNIAMYVQGEDQMVTAEDGTESASNYWEYATISASRVKNDKAKASGKSLQWGSLVQGTTQDKATLDWSKTGAAIFPANDWDVTPTAWEVTGEQTEERNDDKK